MNIIVVGTSVNAVERTPSGESYTQYMGTMQGFVAVLGCLSAPGDRIYAVSRIGLAECGEYAAFLTSEYGPQIDTRTLLPEKSGTVQVEDIQVGEERKVWTSRRFTPIRFEDIPEYALREADAIILSDGGPSTYEDDLIRHAKQAKPGIYVYVDIHCKVWEFDDEGWYHYASWPGWERHLRHADAAQMNLEEAQWLLGGEYLSEPDDSDRGVQLMLAEILGCGVPAANITLGARGAAIGEGAGFGQIVPPVPAESVDACGAGDAFGAGYVWSILRGTTTRRAAQFGNVLAAMQCTKLGYLTIDSFDYEVAERTLRQQYDRGT